MCFSVQASFSTAAVLLFLSALCFQKSKNNAQRLLAGGPLFFGIQQALEGLVWITLNNPGMYMTLQLFSTYGFLFFAYIFWPIYIPATLYSLEKNVLRKKIIFGLLMIGSLVATSGVIALVFFDYTPHALHNHIAYIYNSPYALFPLPTLISLQYILLALYTLALVGSMFVSSVSYMWLSGCLVAIGFIVAHMQYTKTFGSVWCFFAAVTSVVIYWILIQLNKNT